MKPCTTTNVVTFSRTTHRLPSRGWALSPGCAKRDPIATFLPLFEALNWAVALDDHVRAHWAPEGRSLGWGWRDRIGNGSEVSAVRFVRNRVHHQWADALYEDTGGYGPDPMFDEWKWRPSDQLPTGSDDRGHDDYDARLAERPARFTLRHLSYVYTILAGLLEPILPRAMTRPSTASE